MGRVFLHQGCTAAARGVPEERNALQIPAIRIPPRSGCPTPEGLMASWIKTEQNQSWCYSILAAHGNHRRSLKKWMPDLASGKHHKLPLWFSSAARAGNHHCKAVSFKNKKAFFAGGCGRKRKKGNWWGLGAFHRHSPLILTLCSDTGPNFVEQWISTLACRRITWRAYKQISEPVITGLWRTEINADVLKPNHISSPIMDYVHTHYVQQIWGHHCKPKLFYLGAHVTINAPEV